MAHDRRRRLTAILAVLMLSAGLAACAAPAESPDTDRRTESTADAALPPGHDMTFRWQNSPALQPRSAEGTFVRAFVESFELANAGGSSQWGYPGFDEASPSNIGTMVAAYPAQSAPRGEIGTAYYRALRRVDGGDWTRIVLCRHGYRSIRGDRMWLIGYDAPRPVEIDIRRVGAPPRSVPGGDDRTPSVDVFGGWFVPRYDFAARYPTPTADEKACATQAVDGLPSSLPTGGADPWPSATPVPGWSSYPGAA